MDPSLKRVLKRIGKPKSSVFTPDPFQLKALAATAVGDCLVTVPTGAGKTWIAMRAMEMRLERNERAWYACPLKALSNEKYREFKEAFGDAHVGILTGDRKENPNAPVIVGTTEILRNQLYDAMYGGESLKTDLVVLDEAHYLGDPERGVVWEEIMIYLSDCIPLLLLSATIGNARMIAGWLESIRGRPCAVIREKKRPVPLIHLYFHPKQGLLPLFAGKGNRKSLHPDVLRLERGKGKFGRGSKRVDLARILESLKQADLLPAIFFMKSRADCDAALFACRYTHPRDSGAARLRDAWVEKMSAVFPRLLRHPQLSYLKSRAIGAHHAGQLPAWKLLLENLMNSGGLDAIFATSTVAAGVNFPARTVVFLNSDRFNGTEFMPLSSTEYHQMTGRAGRRGMDNVGFSVAVPGRYMDMQWAAALTSAPPSDIQSQIHVNFSMALNLLLSHPVDQILEMLRLSLAAFQARQGNSPGVQADLARQFKKHLTFLADHGYVSPDGGLTADGRWAARLRMDQPLIIAEGLRSGIFFNRTPAIMAGLVAAFMNEKESDDALSEWELESGLLEAMSDAVRILRPFVDALRSCGFDARSVYLRPAVAICRWAQGGAWEEACECASMAEGDLAMLILRTADCLRHLKGLKDVFPSVSMTADAAMTAILREPVIEDVPDF